MFFYFKFRENQLTIVLTAERVVCLKMVKLFNLFHAYRKHQYCNFKLGNKHRLGSTSIVVTFLQEGYMKVSIGKMQSFVNQISIFLGYYSRNPYGRFYFLSPQFIHSHIFYDHIFSPLRHLTVGTFHQKTFH